METPIIKNAPADPGTQPNGRRFTVNVRRANGSAEGNGLGRPRNWSVKYDGPDLPSNGTLVIRNRDRVRYQIPEPKNGGAEVGWLAFTGAHFRRGSGSDRWEPVTPEAWPFGSRVLRVDGSAEFTCDLPDLPVGETKYSYVFYLEGRDDLVDENSTPAIIIKNP